MRPAWAYGPHSTPRGAATDGGSRSGGFEQPKLGHRGHAVIEADLLDDLAIDHLEHSGAGEVHLAAGRSREAANQKVVEGWARMGATAFPLSDDIVALGDQSRRTPEIEIGECGTEVGHERLDVVTAAARFMQRVFEHHVGCGNLVDH